LSLPPPQADRLVPGGPGPVARPPAAARLHSGFLLGGLVLAAGLGVALGLSDRATARNVLGGVTGG